MGFCIFNNVAIAATAALDRLDRVAIIDWDLHHGNGTQKIFSASDRVLFCSIHQGNIFPHTGWVDEIGTGLGKGFTINAPMRAGSTIADYRLVFEEVFIPALQQFKPEVIIVSAGQDPLFDDPKSGMLLFPADFGTLTTLLRDAIDHPLALVLEGGYGPSHGAADTPVLIASTPDGLAACEVLLNLDAAPPPAFERFERLLVIVSVEDEDRRAARERYRFYRERGYRIADHNLARGGSTQ